MGRFRSVLLLLLFGLRASWCLAGNTVPDDTLKQQKFIDSLNAKAYQSYLERPDSARVIAEKALLLSEKISYQRGTGRAYLNLGFVYWSQSYYPQALYYLHNALTSLPEDDKLIRSDCNRLISRTYSDLRDFKNALAYAKTASILSGNDTARVANAYSNYSHIYFLQRDYDRSLSAAVHAIKLDRSINDGQNIGILYSRISDIYQARKQYAKAIAYLDTAVQLSFKVHNRRLRARAYIEYARMYNAQQNYDKAIGYANSAKVLADSTGLSNTVINAYRCLSFSYEGKHDLPQSLVYERKINDEQDSLKHFNQVKSLEMVNDYIQLYNRINNADRIEHANRYNQARLKLQEIIIIILVLSLVVVIFILWLTLSLYRQKRQLTKALQERHAELIEKNDLIETQAANLQAANNVKDRLLTVIGHDLRTPFANLRGIIEIFEGDYITQNELHNLMREVASVVKGSELTLANLMEWSRANLQGVTLSAEKVVLYTIACEMQETFTHLMQRKHIHFECDVPQDVTVFADVNHVRIILRNLINNAAKFTFENGTVKVYATTTGNEVCISVEDTGRGMTEAEINNLFNLNTHFTRAGTLGEKGNGIGLLLVKELVELNGGKLNISSENGKGSVFSFSLPVSGS